jgi:hypothetical protein
MTEHAADLGIDAARISIEGESAGGNIAATTTLMARDRDGPKIIFQVLVDPELDMALIFPSVQEFGQGWGMESSDLKEANKLYFRNMGDATTKYGSPLYAEDLSNLPPHSSSRLSAIPCVMLARRTVVGSGTQALKHLSCVAWASARRRKVFNADYCGVSANVEDRGAVAGVWRRSVQADGIEWLPLFLSKRSHEVRLFKLCVPDLSHKSDARGEDSGELRSAAR